MSCVSPESKIYAGRETWEEMSETLSWVERAIMKSLGCLLHFPVISPMPQQCSTLDVSE